MPKVPSVWTVLSMLEWATGYFKERGVNSPRFSIEWLLAHVLSIKRLDLYLEFDRPLSSDELSKLKLLIKRRAAQEPLQYITGETDFHRVKIKVEPGVLIPRQETEELVEWILESHPENSALNVWDVGTGTGCIPVSLKKARPLWNLFATDISEEALALAHRNAKLNEVEIHIQQDDLFKPSAFSGTNFDLIISNPPYILKEEKSSLDIEVKNYEPEIALFCETIENMYGALEKIGLEFLNRNGTLYLELHEEHADEVRDLFSSRNWEAYAKNDYSDKPRFLKAEKT